MLNAIVSLPHSTRFGVVVAMTPGTHFANGQWHGRSLCTVHYIDPATGNLLECPDKERCKHAHTCPIHSRDVNTVELLRWPDGDIEFYEKEGMVSADLARRAKCRHFHIERRTTHKYAVRASKGDFQVAAVIVTSQTNNDLWQLCIVLTNDAERFGFATLTDPDADDYKQIATAFDGHPLVAV